MHRRRGDRAWLVLFPLVPHLLPWLLGLHADPLWFFAGMTSVWHRVHAGLLPGRPFLDPNMGFTSEALGGLAARDWLHGIVPWWNPYTGIGMPLAGEMQPGAFFLPFSLLLALPDGVLWLTLTMQAVAGLTSHALLRECGCSRLAALTGGLLYELNSTIAWSPGPAAVFCALPFLPLMIWGIERAARPQGGAAARLAVGVGVAYMVLAGFPEPAYLNGLLALAWAAWRVAAAPAPLRVIGRVASGGMLGLCLAAPLLMAFADDLLASDAVATHLAGWQALPWRALGMLALPYVYGTPFVFANAPFQGTLWGGVGFYAGLLTPVLALAGLQGRAPAGLRWLLAGWVAMVLGKAFGFWPVVWAMNHVPAMPDVTFYRYAGPSFGLALVVLAALGLDRLREPGRMAGPLAGGAAMLVAAAAASWPVAAVWRGAARMGTVYGLWALAVALAAAGLAAMMLAWLRWRGRARVRAVAALALFEAFGLFFVPVATGGRHGAVELGAVRFLQAQPGLRRGYTLGPIEPNYGAYYGVAMIDHNVLPVPLDWARYVDAHVLPGILAASGGVVFWPGWPAYGADAGARSVSAHLADLPALGVGFVVSVPRAQLAGLRLAYADPAMDVWAVPDPKTYFDVVSGGPCAVAARARESVRVDCVAPAVLVRRELFMPGWRATDNGAPSAVRREAELLQAVDVASGRHELRFAFAPPFVDFGWALALLGVLGLGWSALGAAVTGRRPG